MKKLNVILFFTLVTAGLMSYFVIPAEKISEIEKRNLAVFPGLEWQNYISGALTDSIEDYIDDHFPERERFLDFADEIKHCEGLHFDEDERIVEPIQQTVEQEDTTTIENDSIVYDDVDGISKGGLLILNGVVYPRNGGVPSATIHFANMANEYAEKLKGKVRVITAIAPLNSAFIPSSKYRYLNEQTRKTFETLRNNLSPEVVFADVFSHINPHASEYIYFKTDHHWTALGAYYAYEAFCEATGLAPVSINDMEKRTKYRFLGTYYSLTKDKTVRNNPDTVDYYVPNVETTAVYYGKTNFKESKSSVFCHNCSGYAVFLHIDYPLMKINTNVNNGKKIVVIKNSYGNAFVPFLISHYQEIWVVDFRYSKHNLMEIINNFNIDDMVFAVGLYSVQSKGVANMMRRLATQTLPVETPKDSVIHYPDY